MPIAPFEMASWTAVATADGLVWSSITIGSNLCPLTPPSAFCMSIRARRPEGSLENSVAAGPVNDVTNAILMGAGVADAAT